MSLPDHVATIVDTYPHWSRAERRILPSITDQVIDYLSDGEGNTFIRNFCERYVRLQLGPDFN